MRSAWGMIRPDEADGSGKRRDGAGQDGARDAADQQQAAGGKAARGCPCLAYGEHIPFAAIPEHNQADRREQITVSQKSVEYSGASRPPISHRVTAKDFRTPTRLARETESPRRKCMLMVMPASSSPMEDILPRSEETDTIKTSTAAAPAQAARLTPEMPPRAPQPKKMASTAPSDAPLETPSV